MSNNKKSEVLSILQPDLLPVEKLIEIMESRCCRAEDLRVMPKEGLVELFRRLVLPLPQRLYRTNRRGKMLTARRAGAGLSTERKQEGSSAPFGRLKPPPDISANSRNGESTAGKPRADREGNAPPDSTRRVVLKRPSEKTPADSDGKRQRTAIKWP